MFFIKKKKKKKKGHKNKTFLIFSKVYEFLRTVKKGNGVGVDGGYSWSKQGLFFCFLF